MNTNNDKVRHQQADYNGADAGGNSRSAMAMSRFKDTP